MKNIIVILILISIISCKSKFLKQEDDYYKIINLVINKGLQNQDSLFINMPYSQNKFNKLKKQGKVHNILLSIDFEEKKVANFLKKKNIIISKKEILNFKKQINKYRPLDTTKIFADKIKYLPRAKTLNDTIKYLSYPYSKYGFGLSKPVITRNGKHALIDYYSKSGGLYILVFEKNRGNWFEKESYLYARR